MRDIPRYDPKAVCDRWVACFDLLGTSTLVSAGSHLEVFHILADARRHARESRFDEVHPVWFSDTFILYTDNNSASDFGAIHSAAKWFMYSLTTKLIPVRGALACGSLYADTESHLFFGNALIESYEYGDSQDWIGLILAPSAAARLRDVGLPPEERLDYACWQVSFKEESEIPQKELFACLFAGAVDGQSRAFCIHQLQEMKRLAEKGTTATPKDNKEMLRKVAKHTRTLSFLEQNVRVRVADTDRH